MGTEWHFSMKCEHIPIKPTEDVSFCLPSALATSLINYWSFEKATSKNKKKYFLLLGFLFLFFQSRKYVILVEKTAGRLLRMYKCKFCCCCCWGVMLLIMSLFTKVIFLRRKKKKHTTARTPPLKFDCNNKKKKTEEKTVEGNRPCNFTNTAVWTLTENSAGTMVPL